MSEDRTAKDASILGTYQSSFAACAFLAVTV
jgi:hypothetical protein